jgi:hypothetical protein
MSAVFAGFKARMCSSLVAYCNPLKYVQLPHFVTTYAKTNAALACVILFLVLTFVLFNYCSHIKSAVLFTNFEVAPLPVTTLENIVLYKAVVSRTLSFSHQ